MRQRPRPSLSLLAALLAATFLAIPTGLAAGLAGGGARAAADDVTGPSLTIPARSSYVIGQVTGDPLFLGRRCCGSPTAR